MKILHLEHDRYPAEAIELLKKHAVVEPFVCHDQEALYNKLSSDIYDAIFVRLGLMIDEKVMALQPSLKYIVTPTTGLNHILTDEAQKHGIQIVSLKGEYEFLAGIKSTAEHTWGLLLSLIRHLHAAHDSVMKGGWDRNPFMSDELDGKTLGILGYGRLGKIVAGYGVAFGMNVLVYDNNAENYQNHAHVNPVSEQRLLQQADYVILLLSFSKENEFFMNAQKFRMMKEGAYFINTSRGELVDESALLNALQSGRLKGAAIDVLRDDSGWSPMVTGKNVLIDYAKQHDNLIITPHMGGYGIGSIERTRSFVTAKFISLLH